MVVGSLSAVEADPDPRRNGAGLDVEIEENFHVVAHEADGKHDHARRLRPLETLQHLADVRLEPGVARRAAPALIGDLPSSMSQAGSYRLRRRMELARVGRALRH